MVGTDKGVPPLEALNNPAGDGRNQGDNNMKLLNRIRSTALARDTRGLSTVEYVIILCLIAAVAVGVWHEFGGMVKTKLQASSGEINEQLPTSFE